MAKVCQITGKKPMSGNNVSHARNRRKRRFLPNLHSHTYHVPGVGAIKLYLTANAMRTIDKIGIECYLKHNPEGQ